MGSHIRFDDVADHSDYDPSDSDDDYTENEKILINKARQRRSKHSDSEEEVFGVGSESDSDDADSNIALSDVEGQEEDDMPDARAWGKDKRKFYSTDYVDPDYGGGFQGKDAQLAELEETEARNLQQQLAQQLDDDDFSLDVFGDKSKKADDDEKIGEEVVKSDISKLSKRQKLQILEKESPEFFGLIQDFNEKIGLARDFLKPVLTKYKKGQLPNSSAIDFVQTQHELILNYCTNILMYLLLKSSRINLQNHPIVKRLYQYRQLLSQLIPVFEEIIKPQIEQLLIENEEPEQTTEPPKKTLALLKKLNKTEKKVQKNKAKDVADAEKPSKKVKFNETVEIEEIPKIKDLEDKFANEEAENNEVEGDAKRAITYKMAKNKGLTPHRKKELRNPRVKHRNKFRKANIRRKGAVRTPRTETKRYGGEISGIKAGVSKSVKIKT